MRFLLFDEIIDHEPGRRVVARREIPADDAVNGHFEKQPLYPGSLVIESMVQTLGWLAIAKHDYGVVAVLTGLEDAKVPSELAPGTHVTLHGELVGTNKRGSVGRAWAEVDGERIGSIGRVLFGHLPHDDKDALRARFQTHGGAP